MSKYMKNNSSNIDKDSDLVMVGLLGEDASCRTPDEDPMSGLEEKSC